MFLWSTLRSNLANASQQLVNFDNCGILCVLFSAISWLPSNTRCHSKISIYPILHHLSVTEDKPQSRKHCHCKAGDRSKGGTKDQVSRGGCPALGVPQDPRLLDPGRLSTHSQYEGPRRSGGSCSSSTQKTFMEHMWRLEHTARGCEWSREARHGKAKQQLSGRENRV